MALAHGPDETPASHPVRDAARKLAATRAVMRILFVVSLAVAPVSVAFPLLRPLLMPAVIGIVLSGGLLMSIAWREGQLRQPDPVGVPGARRRAAYREFMHIASFLAVLAVVIAAALLDWRLLILGSVLAFAGMALFGLPVWLAAAADAAEDEGARRGRPAARP